MKQWQVLRSVLHQLRDHLTLKEAVDLSAQLPMIVRGMYFEGWQPNKVPDNVHTKQHFIDELTSRHFPNAVPTERAVRDVFALLAHHCDPGEIADVIEQLPQELKELWPRSAQTFASELGRELINQGQVRIVAGIVTLKRAFHVILAPQPRL